MKQSFMSLMFLIIILAAFGYFISNLVEDIYISMHGQQIPETLRNKIWVAEAPRMGNRILETRQMWVNGTKAQRAAQFPDGVMERMIDFNPEEEITIPTPQTAGLNAASQVEMIVHQRWAIAILRVKEMITEGANTIVRFHDPESRLEFAHP